MANMRSVIKYGKACCPTFRLSSKRPMQWQCGATEGAAASVRTSWWPLLQNTGEARQEDRKTDRNTDRKTDRKTERQIERQTERQKGRQKDRYKDRQTERHRTNQLQNTGEALAAKSCWSETSQTRKNQKKRV